MTIDKLQTIPEALYVFSKRGKRMVRIRMGDVSGPLGRETTIGYYMRTKEATNYTDDIKTLGVHNDNVYDLIDFGLKLEKMYPKNKVTLGLKFKQDIDLDLYLKVGREKYLRYQTLLQEI